MNERILKLKKAFEETFSSSPERIFSSPGRTEICGNHTDHQHGYVLAASVDKDTLGAVRQNGSEYIHIVSEGYPVINVNIGDLSYKEDEKDTSLALVRGIAAAFAKKGENIRGFDAYIISDVGGGSGISSSAAFEVLIAGIINSLFCKGSYSALDIAKIGHFAENEYFKKPSGLMDQIACAEGGLVFIDLMSPEEPRVEKPGFDFSSFGHRLVIADSGADHADLTEHYAGITNELKSVCAHFGREVLRDVEEEAFFMDICELRKKCGDRAVLRAMHVFGENKRVLNIKEALNNNDVKTFLNIVNASGISSVKALQNITPAGEIFRQEAAFALELCANLLEGKGACRIHGGGFGGTVQVFVPEDMADGFVYEAEKILGKGSCAVMNIRPYGLCEIDMEGNRI